MQPTLLVLAAGLGSRYGGLKQIEPVGPGGETILDYSVYDALRAGFGRLVFVIRHDIEDAFKRAIGAKFEEKLAVDYVFQELDKLPSGFRVPSGREKPWGTTHAILVAEDVVREPFAVINADDFYGATSYRVLSAHLQGGSADYAMVGFVLRKTLSDFGSVSRGVCRCDAQDYLVSVTEFTHVEREGGGARATDDAGHRVKLTGDEVVSMNLWGFTPGLFGFLRPAFADFLKKHGQEEKTEFYIPAAVNLLVTSGQAQVKVLRTPDAWFGITHKEDKPLVIEGIRRLVAHGDYPERLWG
jgi:dTDP-glucose pyrophosphorylase